MDLIRVLVSEHCLIEQVLGCLEMMADRCQSKRKLDADSARDAIAFLRGFSEECHCNKEQDQLLPAMRMTGIANASCLGCSIRERHEEGRTHLDEMEAAVDSASAGDHEAVDTFARHARAYVELVSEYIARQEDCLFPMLVEALPSTEKARLSESLCRAEDNELRACSDDTYYRIANRLADRYGMPRTQYHVQ